MSLLFLDGFDDGLSSAKWNTFGVSISSTGPRTGANCMRLGTGNQFSSRILVPTADEHATFIWGSGFYPESGSGGEFIRFMSDGFATHHIDVQLDGNNRLIVRRGTIYSTNTILGQTANNTIVRDTWSYLEILVTLHDSAGRVAIQLNGDLIMDLTSQDTKNGGTKSVLEGVMFWADFMSGGIRFDDMYLCNGAGSVNNDFLGDCSVQTIFPTGDGNYSQWVGSDGNSVSNYLLVDEASPSSTDYVEGSAAGNKDTYVFGDIPAGFVKGVAHRSYMAKTDTGLQKARQVARIGGTDYAGSDLTLGTGYAQFTRLMENSPATSNPWDVSEVNGAEFGVEAR